MYKNVFVGGTFDTLHKGHVALLTKAFGSGDTVTVGITSDAYVSKFKNAPHKPFTERKVTVAEWLKSQGYADRATIISIDSPYEPAASGDYSAIMVTTDNRLRGDEINYLRDQKGLTPLTLIEISLVSAEDGLPISSTRVRSGAIDERGRMVMPEVLRASLQAPLGKLYPTSEVAGRLMQVHESVIISIGDITTTTFMKMGIVPALSVIDLKVNRQAYQSFDAYRFPETTHVYHVTSGPGHITHQAIETVKDWADRYAQPQVSVLIVDGEEDLLTLPAIVYAPIGSLVYYGQPNLPIFAASAEGNQPVHEGLVEVEVNQQTKERAMELLAKFG
jgi:pantetheine-phosphate adenylyltransferase